MPTGRSGATVTAAGADPNDPALHGLPGEASAKQIDSSPKAGSFSSRFGSPKGISGSLVSSPQAAQPLQEDMFTRAVMSTSDKRDAVESEGVELGTINSSGSIGLDHDSLGQALQSLGPPAKEANQAVPLPTGSNPAAPTQSSAQPVSFQSLSALASQASKRWNNASDDAAAGTSSLEQAQLASANTAVPNAQHPNAPAHVALVPDHSLKPTSRPSLEPQQPTALQSAASDADASAAVGVDSNQEQPLATIKLGKTASMEKKWGYPVPTGSPMFERLRSRTQSQEEAASAAAGLQEHPTAPADVQQSQYPEPPSSRPAEDEAAVQQREAAAMGSSSVDAALPHVRTGVSETLPDDEGPSSEGMSGGMQGTPRGLPRRSASHGDAYAVSPKSW